MALKRILILGVGDAQVDAIRLCKDHGHEVYGVGYRNEGRGRNYTDYFEQIDIADKDNILKYAQTISADAIYSVGSDLAMPTIEYVSIKLNIPHFVDEKIVEVLTHKDQSRQFFNTNNLSPIPFTVAESIGDLSAWKIFPSILKPVDSQGQRGVFKIQNTTELESYFNKSMSFSRSRKVIVEQYINGPEISVNAFVQNGSVIYSFITDRYVVEGLPGGIVKGHGIPPQIDTKVHERIRTLVENTIHALNIQNGPVYFQLKCTDEEVFIIEITPRLDGCHLWRLIKIKYGIDLLELSFQQLAENQRTLSHENNKIAPKTEEDLYLEFFLQKPHTSFRKVKLKPKKVLYREWYYREGETVRSINGYLEKTGYQIYIR